MKCEVCKPGFLPDSAGICVEDAKGCDEGQILQKDGSCGYECRLEEFPKIDADTYGFEIRKSTSCESCSERCLQCIGPEETSCTSCPVNFYLELDSSGWKGKCMSKTVSTETIVIEGYDFMSSLLSAYELATPFIGAKV